MLAKSHINIGFLAALAAKILMPVWPGIVLMVMFNCIPGRVMKFASLSVITGLTFLFPEKTGMLYIPLAVLLGSLFPDLDHPNSTLSALIAPTDQVISILMAAAGAALIYFNWGLVWSMVVGTILLISAVLNLKLFPVEKVKRMLLITAGILLLILTTSKIAVGLGVLYIAMGVLSHRGLTHSVEGLILAGIGALLFSKNLEVQGLMVPFLIGYAAHLIADALTETGVYISYFGGIKISLPLVKTDGITDKLIGTVALSVVLLAGLNSFIKIF